MKWVAYLLVLCLVLNLAQAAVIEGSVYDFYLEKVVEGKAVITTEPVQQMVLVDSTYSFNVPAGEYDLYAYKLENGKMTAAGKETLKVSSDGTYKLDMILFPYFEEENILQESATLFDEPQSAAGINYWPFWLLFVGSMAIMIGLIFLAYFKLKRLNKIIYPKEEPKVDKELQAVLDFIKKENGRTTQKDVRRQFPLSEGKVSLMISELEEKGLVKRIKKGRGNIIVLK